MLSKSKTTVCMALFILRYMPAIPQAALLSCSFYHPRRPLPFKEALLFRALQAAGNRDTQQEQQDTRNHQPIAQPEWSRDRHTEGVQANTEGEEENPDVV